MKANVKKIEPGMCFSNNEMCYGTDFEFCSFISINEEGIEFYVAFAGSTSYDLDSNCVLLNKSKTNQFHIKLLFLMGFYDTDEEHFKEVMQYFKWRVNES
jgi:hypothetical protein